MCSVLGCDSSRHRAQRFRLPEDPEKRLEWFQFVFESNGQRLKESSWTDIKICREHFTDDCFIKTENVGKVQLKVGAVPSLCVQSDPDKIQELDFVEEQVEEGYLSPQSDQEGDSQRPDQNHSRASLVLNHSPAGKDYDQMVKKRENMDVIREKVALLQKKRMYVVNENKLLQLFSTQCPLCNSEVKLEKVISGTLIVMKQQCLRCRYRNQWRNLTSGEIFEESDLEESNHEGGGDSDQDWVPTENPRLNAVPQSSSDETSGDDERDELNPSFMPSYNQLCAECGMFFHRQWPHTCEHKAKPYSCNICGKRYVNELNLTRHSRIHNEGLYRCKYCHKTFKTQVEKITHQQVHVSEEEPYRCSECSETFSRNKDRQLHQEEHTGPIDLKCHICGIEFHRVLSIQRHLLTHTGQKPYKCSVCERGFNQASHLKSHMRLHTGERPFKCQQCSACFNHNVSLKNHIQRYHTPGLVQAVKTGRKKRTPLNADSARSPEQWNEREAEPEPEPGSAEEYEGRLQEVESFPKPKWKRRRTGRPIGRPKKKSEGDSAPRGRRRGRGQDQFNPWELSVMGFSNDDAEDKMTESHVPFCSNYDEEDDDGSEKAALSSSRGSPRAADSDADFDPSNF